MYVFLYPYAKYLTTLENRNNNSNVKIKKKQFKVHYIVYGVFGKSESVCTGSF